MQIRHASTEQKSPKNKNGKKNNQIDIPFQPTNKGNITRENLDMAKKGKP